MAAPARLFGISYSPWTEKARWALEHHGVDYRYREHLLLFGMPELRLRLRRWTGPLTVPALVDGGVVLMDSWDIALHAEKNGMGTALFPVEHLERIRRYNALSEEALAAARILVSERVLRDPEAMREVLPRGVPNWLRGAMSGMTSVGVAYIRKEFGIAPGAGAQAFEVLRSTWGALARDLAAAGGDYLLGQALSYADIAMAVTIGALQPASKPYTRLGPAYRRCWTTPELKEEFGTLIEWRDRLYSRHRPVFRRS